MRRYRTNQQQLQLRPPVPRSDEAARSIAGRTTLGLIVNPKTKEPVIATTDGSYVGIRSLRQASLLKKLGTGYYSTSYEEVITATDLPRANTPDGVAVKGMGYGTALYSTLCDGAHLTFRGLVDIDMKGKGDGISSDTNESRSSEADRWWASALKIGLTSDFTVEGEAEREEGVEIRVDADDLERVARDVDGTIVYVNEVNVDIEKPGEDKTFDIFTYESLTEHHLVAAEIVVELPGVIRDGSDLLVLWRSVLEDPDIIVSTDTVALLALDVRDLHEDAISLLSLAYMKDGQSEAIVDELRQRWERGLDPGATTGQGRLFRANGMADVVEARRISGWDLLSDLP